jgi:hypothetical protein
MTIPNESHLDRLIQSTIRSLSAIQSEADFEMKGIELRAAKNKLNRIEEHLKGLEEDKIRKGEKI